MNAKAMSLALASVAGLALVSNAAFGDDDCKMYFKAGLGYGLDFKTAETKTNATFQQVEILSALELLSVRKDERNTGFMGEVGIGYNFDSNVRADVTLGYNKSSAKLFKVESSSSVPSPEYSRNTIDLSANVFYSFKPDSSFSPFVTVGVGGQSVEHKLSKLGPTAIDILSSGVEKIILTTNSAAVTAPAPSKNMNQVAEIKGKRETTFMYQAGLGFSYMVDQGVYLDVTYKIQSLSESDLFKKMKRDVYIATVTGSNDLDLVTMDTPVKVQSDKFKNNHKHSIMAGLRVEF